MVKVTCKFCEVNCFSYASLCQHVFGQKHRTIVQRVSPDTVEELGRLQYFVDTYMATVPLLGLEYVVEVQAGPSYRHTCMLCNLDLNWPLIVTHITVRKHMEAYINRHHRDLLSSNYRNLYSKEQMHELNTLGEMILTKYGRKQIRVKDSAAHIPKVPAMAGPSHKELPAMAGPSHEELPAMAGPSHEERGKRNNTFLGPPQDSLKGSHTGMLQEGWKGDRTSADCVHYCSRCSVSSPSFLALSQHVMSAQHRQHVQAIQKSRKRGMIQVHRCPLCGISRSSIVALSRHVVGGKHMMKMKLSTPIGEWEVGRLGHFIDTYIPEEPILGLEYIVETKLDSSYKYSCKLCTVNGKLKYIVDHLMGVYHPQLYIKKHYCSMLPFAPKGLKKALHITLLKYVAENILDRKENGTPMEGDDKRREDPASERSDEESNDLYDYNTTLTKPDVEGPPLTKRVRLLPKEDLEALPARPHTYQDPYHDESHTMELQVTSAVQELEFNNNQQFFEYLANFKIKDYHDVILIQKITQNCIRALKKFQEEEAQRLTPGHEPEDPFVYTNSIDQKILDMSVNPESPPLAPESLPLAPETVSPKDTFNSPSELIPKNDVTDFFFSSIKNMDESEVVGIFQKIATTNPEFQGMNIPALIRYLKDSGRLNAA